MTESISISPFARQALYRNPFGELTRQERADLALVDVESCLAKFEKPQFVLQIIGPCGHGKTTHLLAIERALQNRGLPCDYVYFPEDGRRPAVPKIRPLLVDEAQRVGWWRMRKLLTRPGPLVLGTHIDLTARFERAGFSVQTIDLSVGRSTEQLQAILNSRIESSRMPPTVDELQQGREGHPLCMSMDQVVELENRFGSNIRLIEQHLYEVFQRKAERGETWQPAS